MFRVIVYEYFFQYELTYKWNEWALVSLVVPQGFALCFSLFFLFSFLGGFGSCFNVYFLCFESGYLFLFLLKNEKKEKT